MTVAALASDLPPVRVVPLGDGPENVYAGQWPDRILPSVTRPELHIYGVAKPKARAIVCAGGGYVQLMHDKEGVEIALWLNRLGIEAGVLVHRLPGAPDGNGGVWPSDIALTDGVAGLRALGDDLPVVIVGLSSGGHLAGVLATQEKVKGVVIAYAPVNANHKDYKAPAGKPDFPPPEKQAFYNAWPIGIAAEPHGMPQCPVFLAYALSDAIVPIEHALNFIKSARDKGLDLDAHIFGQAPHGFCLREDGGTQAAWPGLAEQWMARKLGI